MREVLAGWPSVVPVSVEVTPGDGVPDADNDRDGRINEDPGADLNNDGVVNGVDLATLLTNWS